MGENNSARAVHIATVAGLLLLASGAAEAVKIKAVQCTREAATKANNVAQGVCKSQAGSREGKPSSTPSTVYLVTLTPEESRGGTKDALGLAEREARRQGLCSSGVELVAQPERVGRAGETQLSVRCTESRAR